MKRWLPWLGSLALLAGVVPPVVPQALAFPYREDIAGQQVWSESPIDRTALERVLERTHELVSASPIAVGDEPRRIFLTQGGWRWHWLTGRSRAFAISRPLTENIVINSHDVARDQIVTSPRVGGKRRLSAVLAHETAHGMLRRRYGITVDFLSPQWLREGYCDYVARESSLTPKDVAELEAQGADHPAFPYYFGRLRVAKLLEENGGSVDALFSS